MKMDHFVGPFMVETLSPYISLTVTQWVRNSNYCVVLTESNNSFTHVYSSHTIIFLFQPAPDFHEIITTAQCHWSGRGTKLLPRLEHYWNSGSLSCSMYGRFCQEDSNTCLRISTCIMLHQSDISTLYETVSVPITLQVVHKETTSLAVTEKSDGSVALVCSAPLIFQICGAGRN